jgi:hypothetical protein
MKIEAFLKKRNSFSELSITAQMKYLQKTFQNSAQKPVFTKSDDEQIWSLMESAKMNIGILAAKGIVETSRSYAIYNRWINFLYWEKQYRLHIFFLQKFLKSLSENRKTFQPLINIQIYPFSVFLSYQETRDVISIQMQEAVIGLADSQIKDLAHAISSRKKEHLNQIFKAIQQEPQIGKIRDYFQENLPVRKEMIKTNGRYFNLVEVFSKVNKTFFNSTMKQPIIKWSAQPNKCRMGTYNYQTDTIMINKALDQKQTPDYVIEFVMYHEMLHKALGFDQKGNRRIAHTTKFRKLEKSFPDYEKAEAYINHLSMPAA